MPSIGRKIYYELNTGNFICSTSSVSEGIPTTIDQDFVNYADLVGRVQSSVGVIQLDFGQYEDNFQKYPNHHVDISKTPPVIVWDMTVIAGASLAQVQQEKIDQITDLYNQTLEAGFPSSCTGKPLVYDYGTESQKKWSKLFISLSIPGALPDAIFPLNLTIKDGTLVPHTKAQLTQLCGDLTLWELPLEAKYQAYCSATGSIMSATTVDQVNAISW
jgi:hypothetical protein